MKGLSRRLWLSAAIHETPKNINVIVLIYLWLSMAVFMRILDIGWTWARPAILTL